MTTGANVHSSEAIEAVRGQSRVVCRPGAAMRSPSWQARCAGCWNGWSTTGRDIGRTRSALAHDQVHEAQQALHRCLMFPIANERPSCYEERAALKKAQARLAYCEEKVERVRHWQRTVQHELFEYEGRISQLVRTRGSGRAAGHRRAA